MPRAKSSEDPRSTRAREREPAGSWNGSGGGGLRKRKLGTARIDGHRERLACDPLPVLEEVCVRLGDRQGDPVRELEPRLLAQRVGGVNEVVDAPSAQEIVVEVEVERDRQPVAPRNRPAVLALPLDEDFVAA